MMSPKIMTALQGSCSHLQSSVRATRRVSLWFWLLLNVLKVQAGQSLNRRQMMCFFEKSCKQRASWATFESSMKCFEKPCPGRNSIHSLQVLFTDDNIPSGRDDGSKIREKTFIDEHFIFCVWLRVCCWVDSETCHPLLCFSSK